MVLLCAGNVSAYLEDTNYGTGVDGNLVFTTTTKIYGNLSTPADYTVAGNTLYLDTNRIYDFNNIYLGAGTTLSTTDTNGIIMYLKSTTRADLIGDIDLNGINVPGQRSGYTIVLDGNTFTASGSGNGGTSASGNAQGKGFGAGGDGGAGSNAAGDGGVGGYPGGAGGSQSDGLSDGGNGGASAGGGGGGNCGGGGAGNAGGNAYSNPGEDADVCGAGVRGGGGGAGGSAGIGGIHLAIKAPILISSGSIFVNGSDGGNGGAGGTAQNGGVAGFGGGGGGGGDGGYIYFVYGSITNAGNLFWNQGNNGTSFGGSASKGSNGTYFSTPNFSTPDFNTPFLDYEFTFSSGFGGDNNVTFSLTCWDDRSDALEYDVYVDGVSMYHEVDFNNATDTNWTQTNGSSNPTWIFSCTDASGNVTLETVSPIYDVNFILVNEATGAFFSINDLNAPSNGKIITVAKVFSVDGNYTYDFLANNTTSVRFVGEETSFIFEFDYNDTAQTVITRPLNFAYIEDENIGVCTPYYQSFYQQRFVANTARATVLKSNVADCYSAAGELEYVYDTGYALTVYTIQKPYYLYIWIDGVKTFLALLDGGVAFQYNLDAIAFSRTQFDITVGQDTIGFAPLINTVTGIYDTNTILIYYKSYSEDNTQVTFTIKNGASTIWGTTETTSPNEAIINFYWGGLGITDQNVLELVVVTLDASSNTTTKSYYFTIAGGSYQNFGTNEWVVIVAVLFFLFGITLVAANKAFGIFGIIIALIGMGILSWASGTWWVTFFQGIFLILIMYIFMMGKTVAGELG